MKTYSFEKLEVWILAKNLTLFVYRITKNFPDDERFGLVSQMRRAAISVNSNLAEGNYRTAGRDKARFTEIAYCSLMELMNQGIIAYELNYVAEVDLQILRKKADQLAGKMSKLKDYQLTLV